MYKSMLMSLMLIACGGGEQGFGQGKGESAGTGGDGLIEVFPDEVVWERVVVGQPETEGFRITSVGESPLRVTDVSISDAGSTEAGDGSAPEAVFRDLRAFEPDKHTIPFSLESGESAEFLLTAQFLQAGVSTGEVRIRSNDTEADGGPAPGDFRLSLRATGVDPSSPGDDTGDAPTDDTGDAPTDDTGDAPTDDTGSGGGTVDTGSGGSGATGDTGR